MTDLFIASREAIPHADDGSRRAVADGWLKRKRAEAGDGAYPEDWQEQGWCCRECAVMAWYGMGLELRRQFAAEVAARRARR